MQRRPAYERRVRTESSQLYAFDRKLVSSRLAAGHFTSCLRSDWGARYLSRGMRNAWGIPRSSVARTAPCAPASCARWPSVVCFAVLTQLGRCEMSWPSGINVKLTIRAALSRCNRLQACPTVNPYCGACARTRTKPSSVIEQVASSEVPFVASLRTHRATPSWNSCSRKPSATRAFTSSRYFMETQPKSHGPAYCSNAEPLIPRLEPEDP